MENLNQEQLDKLEELKSFLDKSSIHDNLPLVEELSNISDKLEKIGELIKTESEKPDMPEVHKMQLEGVEVVTIKGDKPTEEELLNLIKPLIPEVKDGNDYVLTEQDKKEIAKSIKVPIVEKIIERTEVIKEQPIVTNEIKEIAVSDTPEQIAEKLNTTEQTIEKNVIIGLVDELRQLRELINNIPRGGSRSVGGMKLHDLSSQTNGSTKIFSVPKGVAGFVIGSDFPTVLIENNGFTLNGSRTQLTITAVNAPSTGSQLLYVYSSLFN